MIYFSDQKTISVSLKVGKRELSKIMDFPPQILLN